MKDKFDLDTGELLPPVVRPPWWRMSVKTPMSEESIVQQHLEPSANVNAIVARFRRTGEFPSAKVPPVYADVTGLQGDFTERVNASRLMMEAVARAADKPSVDQASSVPGKPQDAPAASVEPPKGG